MELKLGVFRFLPTTHAETNANKMRPRTLRAMRRFMHVYLHRSDRSTYAPDESRLFCSREKPDTPNLSPMLGSKWRRFLDLRSISVVAPETSHPRQDCNICTFLEKSAWNIAIESVVKKAEMPTLPISEGGSLFL